MRALPTTGHFVPDKPMVLSLMFWPSSDDKQEREQWAALQSVRGELSETSEGTVQIAVSTLRLLVSAPAYEDIVAKERERGRAGFVAGSVLVAMFFLDRYADRLPKRGAAGASLNKAFAIVAKWGGQGNTFGDGSPLPKSDRTIKDAWSQFRDVAHLWAALSVNAAFPWAPEREALSSEHFGTFLGVAAGFQQFGLGLQIQNRTTKKLSRLLDPLSLWHVDTTKHAPVRLHKEDPGLFESSPMFEFLRSYASSQSAR